ncbi:GrpB family protein [Microbacterium sp. 22242]|uniref:GrpB family protein n=1 Tax=Microbacterium sp. 22242 TaxID=3453896 RepID=UPI003F84A356
MIDLQPHHPEWAHAFRREASMLRALLAGRIDAVEHIGSTAIPALLAKPIIDLAARAASATDPFALGPPLADSGYRPHTDGPKSHAVYVRSSGERRTHILHVFTTEQWTHCNQRLFRDRLLRDATARSRYQALKESLVDHTDGKSYTAAKRALITELVNDERALRSLPPTDPWDK